MSKLMRLAKMGNGPGDNWPGPLNERIQSLVEAFMMAAEPSEDLGKRGKGGLAAHLKTVAVKRPCDFIRLWVQISWLEVSNPQDNKQHQFSPHNRIRSIFETILMMPEAVGDPSKRVNVEQPDFQVAATQTSPRIFESFGTHPG